MKIKLSSILKKNRELIKELNSHNIEIDDDSIYEIILAKGNTKDNENIIAKTNEDEFKIINPKTILYFETYDNSVYAIIKKERFKLKEKLYYYEEKYCTREFIRISKSHIVNIKEIEKIKTTFNRKFILVMTNGEEIDVNRSYYEIFKERIGL